MININKMLRKILKKYYISVRQKYYSYFVIKKCQNVGAGLRVNGKSRVNSKTVLGNNVNFNGMTIIGAGKVTIGNNFHSGPGCIIMNSYHNYDKGTKIPYDSTYIHKDVNIEDNVWLGSNVTILGGVTIGEGAIIQIGSVVVSSIPPLGIAGGHPAKVYKYRDKEHYFSLKKESKFH
jgi:acetyltransferase-like isoleucine patch superfamily enzyme